MAHKKHLDRESPFKKTYEGNLTNSLLVTFKVDQSIFFLLSVDPVSNISTHLTRKVALDASHRGSIDLSIYLDQIVLDFIYNTELRTLSTIIDRTMN